MILGIIPARYASTRFPGKPLVQIQGKTMIQRVYEQCLKTPSLKRVIVATDDERIFQHVQAFGGKVEMTSSSHLSGTDRIAEVVERHPEVQFCLNIQGDEPFIQPEQIEQVCQLLQAGKQPIATLKKRIKTQQELLSPDVVKVVCDQAGKALYFSRAAIPVCREKQPDQWLQHQPYFRHIGLYGFERKTLLKLAKLSPTSLEQSESLEQLRWMDHGYHIQVAETEYESQAVDRPEDLQQFE